MFTIYTKAPFYDVDSGVTKHCQYCDWSKELFDTKQIKYHEIECEYTPQIFHDYEHKSYPLVFHDAGNGDLEYVGGYEALVEYLDWNEL